MENVTQHARVRCQQRGIESTGAIDILQRCGKKEYDHHGGVIRYLDHQARQRVVKLYGEVAGTELLDRCRNVYLVESATDGTIITLGHRHKKLCRNPSRRCPKPRRHRAAEKAGRASHV